MAQNLSAPSTPPTLRQARARPRRSQRADGERQDHRRNAHRACRADDHRNRTEGRQSHPARAFRAAEGPRPEGVAEAGRRGAASHPQKTRRLRGRLRRRSRGESRRRDEERRRAAAGKHPLPQGRRKERSGVRRASSRSSATSMSTTRSRPRTAPTPRPKGWRASCPPTRAARCRRSSRRSARRWSSRSGR